MSLGIISKEVYSSVVFVSFITTVFALVALKKLYEGDVKTSKKIRVLNR